ncbi:MAG TPA: hypothetical protein PKY59_01715 [Pyrinomonadaceae bacterium]|nr:hypothetical protein [Pyrinomonadaceae bacterium]
MQKVFRFIKKKRSLRRLSAVWLFLVIIELFCPVFCDEPTFAATSNPSQTTVNRSIEETEDNSETSITDYDHQNSDEKGNFCNDECLCHAMVVMSLNFVNIKDSLITGERMAFSYGEPLFNSLSPPYIPPKNS